MSVLGKPGCHQSPHSLPDEISPEAWMIAMSIDSVVNLLMVEAGYVRVNTERARTVERLSGMVQMAINMSHAAAAKGAA